MRGRIDGSNLRKGQTMERSSCQLENFTVMQKKIKVRNGFSAGPTIMCNIFELDRNTN